MPKRLQSRAEETASAAPLGDQRAGESGATAPISACAGPSGVPTKSAYAPPRSLRKARRPSTGLHWGKRLFELLPIASRAPLPSGAASQIDQRPLSLRSNASVEPSCDQPAADAVAIAIEDPSGDQTGPVTSELGGAMPLASGRTSAPLVAGTASTSPSRNAIWVPSGDQVASVPGTLPTWRSLASRTLVAVPVSTSNSPLPGRKPRARPGPMTSTSWPRTAGVKSTSPPPSPAD